MDTHISTTPFGRRSLSLAMISGQVSAKECTADARADKWRLFRTVCESKSMLGVTDRALAVLNALLSFHPDTEIAGDGNLVVFPSNQQLSLRAHGMAPATLRRHLSVLVECGLVVRRDSPNGKRFARKGQGGVIEQAYGFDLSPLLARAGEFEHLADCVRAERRELQLIKERVTLYRRDIAKMIAFGLEEGIAADWEGLHAQYRAVVSLIPRTSTRDELAPLTEQLRGLATRVHKTLESHVKSEESSASESQTERHKQNSNTHSHIELEPASKKELGGIAEPNFERVEPAEQPQAIKPPTGYPLGLVLRACPDIADYARDGISGWAELIATANVVRGALGVSPDAWSQACETLGAIDAAIVVAAILQRSDQIGSPGGYLRSLTDKARNGQFSVGPLLMALLRARGRSPDAATG